MTTCKHLRDPEDMIISSACKQKRIEDYFLTKETVGFNISAANQYVSLANSSASGENQNGAILEDDTTLQRGAGRVRRGKERKMVTL